MKKQICKGGEATAAKLTEEMILSANRIVDQEMNGRKEDLERCCCVWGERWKNRFSIECRTSFDYRSYKFTIQDDGSISYDGMEGDFRD